MKKAQIERAEIDTLLEGRAAAFSVDIETKCVIKINSLKQQIKDDDRQKEANIAELIKKMEDQIKRFNDEYE